MPASLPVAGRLTTLTLRLGFWLPLLACTWLALVPEPPDNPVFRLSDVILHAAAFTYLTFAFVLMSTPPAETMQVSLRSLLTRSQALRALLAMLAYGLFLELAQSFIPERTAELKDLWVDLVGIGIGLLAAWLLARPAASLVYLLLSRVSRQA